MAPATDSILGSRPSRFQPPVDSCPDSIRMPRSEPNEWGSGPTGVSRGTTPCPINGPAATARIIGDGKDLRGLLSAL
jgi:hypothetical protein